MEFRKIIEDEKRLLTYLINKSNIDLSDDLFDLLRVSEMSDDMGSLYLSFASDNIENKREYGKNN